MNEVVEERSDFKSSYKTTRSICYFLSFIGWLTLIGGILGAMLFIDSSKSSQNEIDFVAILPFLGVLVVGLLLVMQGQLTRAVADTADSTSETAAILRVMMRQQQVTTTPVKDSQVL